MRWLVYTLRMIDYKIIGWRWRYERPPHPNALRGPRGSRMSADVIIRYRCTGCDLDEPRDWYNARHYTGTSVHSPICTGRMRTVRFVPETTTEREPHHVP